jgi:hypothetical protein
VRRGETHGKHDLCHAFSFGRTTIFFKKNDASFIQSVGEKKIIVRRGENARQT